MGFRSRVLGVVAALGIAMIALPAAAQEQVDDDCYPIPEGGCPGGEVIDTEEPPETEPAGEQEQEPEQEAEPAAVISTTEGEPEGAQVLGVALAVTGAELALLVALGLVAITGGGFALRSTRRRAGHQPG
jgi:hypothetical protein